MKEGISKRGIADSDVARPLSYKTRPLYQDQDSFFKTIKLLIQDHWCSKKFWLGRVQIGKILVT